MNSLHEQLLPAGIAGETKLGNTQLVEYGIQTEESDIRAHVCVLAKTVYVYRTIDGLSCVLSGKYARRPVYTGTIVTAQGYAVPANDVPGCQVVTIPDPWLNHLRFSNDDSTSIKGEKAIKVVKGLLKTGRFPLLPIDVSEVDDEQMQISGTDIKVSLSVDVKIQVKCDYRGGNGPYSCTGNLFLQVTECNPYRSV